MRPPLPTVWLVVCAIACALGAGWSLLAAVAFSATEGFTAPVPFAGLLLMPVALGLLRREAAARFLALFLLPYLALCVVQRSLHEVVVEPGAWRWALAACALVPALVWGWLWTRSGRRVFGVLRRAQLERAADGAPLLDAGRCSVLAGGAHWPGSSAHVRCHRCGGAFDSGVLGECASCGDAMLTRPILRVRSRPANVVAVTWVAGALSLYVLGRLAGALSASLLDGQFDTVAFVVGVGMAGAIAWPAAHLWRGGVPSARGWLSTVFGLAAAACATSVIASSRMALMRFGDPGELFHWFFVLLWTGALFLVLHWHIRRDRVMGRWMDVGSIPPTRSELKARGGTLSFDEHASATGIPGAELALVHSLPVEEGVHVSWRDRSWILDAEGACPGCGSCALADLPAGRYCGQCGHLDPAEKRTYRE